MEPWKWFPEPQLLSWSEGHSPSAVEEKMMLPPSLACIFKKGTPVVSLFLEVALQIDHTLN